MAKQYDLLVRLLVVGDSGVGKTCILCKFVDEEYSPKTEATTIGIDFKVKHLEMRDKRIRLQIWDTAGQERFETITKQYYRRAQWLSYVKQFAQDNIEVTLVGNKLDLEDWRQVTYREGKQFSELHGIPFYETSVFAETDSVATIYSEIVDRILKNQSHLLARQKIESLPSSDSDDEFRLVDGQNSKQKSNNSCCQSA